MASFFKITFSHAPYCQISTVLEKSNEHHCLVGLVVINKL